MKHWEFLEEVSAQLQVVPIFLEAGSNANRASIDHQNVNAYPELLLPIHRRAHRLHEQERSLVCRLQVLPSTKQLRLQCRFLFQARCLMHH